MKARIYWQGWLLGEMDVELPVDAEREPSIADRIDVALLHVHPKPNDKPLFATGRLETL